MNTCDVCHLSSQVAIGSRQRAQYPRPCMHGPPRSPAQIQSPGGREILFNFRGLRAIEPRERPVSVARNEQSSRKMPARSLPSPNLARQEFAAPTETGSTTNRRVRESDRDRRGRRPFLKTFGVCRTISSTSQHDPAEGELSAKTIRDWPHQHLLEGGLAANQLSPAADIS
jgi:hypothetical protein